MYMSETELTQALQRAIARERWNDAARLRAELQKLLQEKAKRTGRA